MVALGGHVAQARRFRLHPGSLEHHPGAESEAVEMEAARAGHAASEADKSMKTLGSYFNTIRCFLSTHDWTAAGWGKSPDPDSLRLFFRCGRCSKQTSLDEKLTSVQARFDGYRKKYGDALISYHEFRQPYP